MKSFILSPFHFIILFTSEQVNQLRVRKGATEEAG